MDETSITTPEQTQDASIAVIDASESSSQAGTEQPKEVKLTRREIETEAEEA